MRSASKDSAENLTLDDVRRKSLDSGANLCGTAAPVLAATEAMLFDVYCCNGGSTKLEEESQQTLRSKNSMKDEVEEDSREKKHKVNSGEINIRGQCSTGTERGGLGK